MQRFTIASLASAILGYLVWWASPYLVGTAEPWDSPYPFYSAVLFLGGGAIWFIAKGQHWDYIACWLGVWLGQVQALRVLPDLDRSWIALGIFTTFAGSLIAVIGMMVCAAIFPKSKS